MPDERPTTILVAFDSRRGTVERLAEAVADGARSVPGTAVVVKRVDEIGRDDLLAADGLALGSPVHMGTISTPVKRFLDAWQFAFDFYPSRPMRDRVGAAFATGGQESGGQELTMLTILVAFLHNGMIAISGGGPYGAAASTETRAEPIDEPALVRARELGRRLADLSAVVRRGRDVAASATS
jgi:NAD(P)H dehydrogenase (quinone)